MVTALRTGNLVATVTARQHTIVSGLNAKSGGGDEGPDPHDLLEAALAACTILTAELYAKQKGIKLEKTEVVITITSETKEATAIARDINFIGDLTAEDRQKLLEIADKCPIHRMLEGSVKITTTLIENN